MVIPDEQKITLQSIDTSSFGIDVKMLRLDLVHPYISGNKWFKLKHNLQEAKVKGFEHIMTFGGAFSNHILATAAAGKMYGIKTTGIIRGEEHLPLNSTLAYAQSCGMALRYMDRTTYRKKNEPEIIASLQEELAQPFIIPEGGSNEFAVKGCKEIMDWIPTGTDYICLAAGTGGTSAGLLSSPKNTSHTIVFPALKGGGFLQEDISSLMEEDCRPSWSLQTDYHFGGYAKKKPELLKFIDWFFATHHIPLDFIYTGKLMFGVFDLMKKGYFPSESSIVCIHTGGLRPEDYA